MEKCLEKLKLWSVLLSLLISPLAMAENPFEFTPEIQSRMFIEAENLLAELEDQVDMPEEQRLATNGKFRKALAALGKDQWALAAAFTGRLMNRYPEVLPGYVVYNGIKYGIVIPAMIIAGYWAQASALAAAPDSGVLIVTYAAVRLPQDVLANKKRSGYWFHQIFKRRDELLGLRPESPKSSWPYFSPHSRFQFFNVKVPIGTIDGELQYEEVFLPIRRLGSLRLMEEMLLPAGLISESYSDGRRFDDEVTEKRWLDETTLTAMLADEMGEEEFNEFFLSISRLTFDARLRQMAMLEWLLKNSFRLSEINNGLLKQAQTQLSPLSKILATIEMTRSEIQFHKKALRRTSREERKQRREDESWNVLRYGYNTTMDYFRGLPEQFEQGKIIRKLNQLELDIIAAELDGEPGKLEEVLREARAILFAINLEHQTDTISTSDGCESLLQAQ